MDQKGLAALNTERVSTALVRDSGENYSGTNSCPWDLHDHCHRAFHPGVGGKDILRSQ